MSEFFMTNRLLGVDVSVRAISVIVLICVLFSVVIQSAEAVQTVAQRVAQQEEPFIDTSEWVQSTSPFGDAYDQNFITETIVRGYRGADSERSISPNYRDEAIEFSKESKIQPIHYASSPTKPAAAQGNLTTQVNFNSSEQASIRPIPDATINAGDNHAQANPQFADTRNLSTNSYGQGYAPPGFASQASYVQPSYAQPFYPQGSYNQTQNYFASNVTSSNPSPYQISSAYGGYPVNYLPTNYANQPNSQQYQAPPSTYTSMLTNCCDPVYQPTQFTTPNVNPNPSALQTYPQYGGSNYGFGGTQPHQRTTWVPVIPLRSMPYGTYLGQGIIGQPVAYVDGEPVRNFVRYIFP
jgi:hypothetical protein